MYEINNPENKNKANNSVRVINKSRLLTVKKSTTTSKSMVLCSPEILGIEVRNSTL